MAVIPFKLADIGEGIAEVELMQWFVSEGDKVKSFDRLCEVQSDKATVEITSRYGGIVTKVHHKVGDIVNVGSALVDIETDATAPASASREAPSPCTTGPDPMLARGSVQSNGKVLTTPAVRKIAKENQVDLNLVIGTGPKGRVLKEDMLKFVKQMSEPHKAHAAPSPAAFTNVAPAAALSGDVIVPVRGIQRLMVKSMTAAGQVH